MVVVTGGSEGIGRAVVDALGYTDSFIVSRSYSGPSDQGFSCDIADAEQVARLGRTLREINKFRPITGLVNAAGIASMNLALMMPPETVYKIINTNLVGTILVNQAVAKLLIRNNGGSIVNFSTIAVALGLEGEAVYAASKAGVEQFSNILAKELSGFGVRVNVVAPGPIETKLIGGIDKQKIEKITDRQVMQRSFTTAEVASLVKWLLSNDSSAISGEVLSVGGS